MLEQIKFHDGSIQDVAEIPADIKEKYKEVFEIEPVWLLRSAAARGKWIDQSQSHNIFMQGTSGKKLSDIYMTAWKSGLKTTYYMRTLGASQIEKSTLDAKKFGFTQKRDYTKTAPTHAAWSGTTIQPATLEALVDVTPSSDQGVIALCRIDNPECESCQ